MTYVTSKWHHLFIHALPSLTGLLRLLFRHPVWMTKLLYARTFYFISRRFPAGLMSSDGFNIETPSELISYWTFFVEREGWSREWADALQHHKNPLILDVGANAGVFTHWVWTQNSNTEFIVFEPLPKMTEKIQKWQERTKAHLTLQKVAVSNHCGTAVFYASTDNDTSASLQPDSPKAMELSVQLVTLDSVVPDKPILLVKIDVEGCENEVLIGATRTLANTRFLLIEAHTERAFLKIRSTLSPSIWDCRKMGPSDYFFIRR